MTLSYTYLRALGGERIAIPNERIAAGVLRNDSLGGAPLAVEASVWIAPDADPARALEVLEDAAIAEATPDGIRLVASAGHVPVAERAKAEAELRSRSLTALHAAGLLPRPQ